MAKAEGESVLAQGALGKLIRFLAEEGDLSATEIAETLWVALKMEPAIELVVEKTRSSESKQSATPSITPTPSTNEEDTASVQPPTRANLATTAAPQAGVLPTKALPVWIADPSMLNDPLALIRALKPLLRQVEAGPGRQLDESATVDGIARTQLWLPVLKAETEPWFDIVLIVDRSSSMHLWQRLATDLERILRQYGAFRDLQVFDLVVDAEAKDDAVRLKSHSERPGHHPKELIDQRGRRIVIVLSDCAATYWWDGKLLPMLQAWANVMPTVVWQMLPEWMWARTALGRGRAVALNNGIAGAENQRLRPLPLGQENLSSAERKRVSMPVVTSDPDDLLNWSLMLSGDRQELTPGFLLPQPGGQVPKSKTFEEIAEEGEVADDAEREVQIDSLAQSRVERFLQLSSPPARRLVMLLAAAPVITLPVMRLIRDAMMTDTTAKARSPLPVAEVFLSGLLQRVPEQNSPDVMTEPELAQSHANDLVQYDFVPRVRKQLLKLLPAVDTVDVVNRVTAAVEDRWNTFSTQKFRAFLLDPQAKAPEGLAGMRSFASVTAEILKDLGGQYADFAEELRQGAAGEPELEREDIDDDFEIPELRTLDFFRAQVREETPPLQLVMDEFTIATVEIEQPLPEDLDAALREIAAIEDESLRVVALIELAPQLAGATFSLLVRVVKVVQEILSDRNRLHIFSTLLPYLPDRLQAQMQTSISELEGRVGLALVEFEFEVARVLRQRSGSKRPAAGRTGWTVQRDRQAAYQFVEPLDDAISLEMVAIPAGTFRMGSPESEPQRYDDESPQHEVSVTAFFMGRYPITQAQWRFVAGLEQVNRALDPDPSRFEGNERPVERVSWEEAVEFCDRLSQHTGNNYQLPTEAQWEYACRAGTTTPFHFGDTILPELANYDCTESYGGGAKGEHRQETTPVDEFGVANAFGLCDMHGNVWEWCADHWHSNYEGAPIDGSAWLTNNKAENWVSRGGSWDYDPRDCRSATRSSIAPVNRNNGIGFRVSCLAPRTLQPPTD